MPSSIHKQHSKYRVCVCYVNSYTFILSPSQSSYQGVWKYDLKSSVMPLTVSFGWAYDTTPALSARRYKGR